MRWSIPWRIFRSTLSTRAFKGKTIVLHGADYDLRLLAAGGRVRGGPRCFDTMLAARLIGRREFSYAALVKAEFGIDADQRLAKGQLGAPAPDAHHGRLRPERYPLPARNLRPEKLEGTLNQLGRWEWFEQSCARALASAAMERERDVDGLLAHQRQRRAARTRGGHVARTLALA